MSSQKEAILFSAFVPNKDSLQAAKTTWDVIVRDYSDCDVFMGINPPLLPKWVEEIHKHPNVTFEMVPDNLVVNSDASAFLTALKLYRERNQEYKTVWVGHTKGTTRWSDSVLRMVDLFWTKREKHSKHLHDNSWVGGTAVETALCGDGFWRNSSCVSMIGRFEHTHYPNRLMGLHSVMSFKGDIFHKFATTLQSRFFEKNLVTELVGFDRYFVERDLATIPSLFGKVLLPFLVRSTHGPFEAYPNCIRDEFIRWQEDNPNKIDLPDLDLFGVVPSSIYSDVYELSEFKL
jgi:hypothetical protein